MLAEQWQSQHTNMEEDMACQHLAHSHEALTHSVLSSAPMHTWHAVKPFAYDNAYKDAMLDCDRPLRGTGSIQATTIAAKCARQ